MRFVREPIVQSSSFKVPLKGFGQRMETKHYNTHYSILLFSKKLEQSFQQSSERTEYVNPAMVSDGGVGNIYTISNVRVMILYFPYSLILL